MLGFYSAPYSQFNWQIFCIVPLATIVADLTAMQLAPEPYNGCFEGLACNEEKYCCTENVTMEKSCPDPNKDYCMICPLPRCDPQPISRGSRGNTKNKKGKIKISRASKGLK